MNRTTTIAAIALSFAAAGSAFADDITIDNTPFQSTKTRADVQAEMAHFKQQRVNPWSTSYNVLTGFQSQRSRAEVVAEVKAARASGELDAIGGEDSGSFHLAQQRRPAGSTGTLVAAGQ